MNLTYFEVTQLHGTRSLRLSIDQNMLILVGENGSGKTTLINLLYFFLSRQWHRLTQYDFGIVRAVIDGHDFLITREALQAAAAHPSRLHRFLPRGAVAELHEVIASHHLDVEELLRDRRQVTDLAHRFGVPTSALVRHLSDLTRPQLELTDALERRADELKALVKEQVLYLPTYRRIEQDLKSVFPEMDEHSFRERLSRRRAPTGFIELVEFGMEDVAKAVQNKMGQLKENNRTGLTNLATTYLRDVISGEYRTIHAGSIKPTELQAIQSVFSRIDDKMLPAASKERLGGIVAKIQAHQSVDEEERVIALFLLKLLELHHRQQALERTVRQFVDICNKYLVGKRLSFDATSYNVAIELSSSELQSTDESNLELRDLSSGEKQVVSLFSHLLLSDVDQFFILIDEPELSLSVPWQQTFLPDILSTERCTGLVAVTHSPFIFDNTLDKFGHSLSEFWVAQ